MANIDYPTILPDPLIDGSLSWSEFDQRKKVTTWNGSPVTIPVSDDAPAIYNVTVLCNEDELNTFVDFYKNTLKYGTEWFNMNLSAAGQVFKQEVNFLSNAPSIVQVDKLFRVNMNLTTRVAFKEDQAVVDRALQYLGDGFKYISELPVSDVTFDSTLITWDSTIVTFDESTNPFY